MLLCTYQGRYTMAGAKTWKQNRCLELVGIAKLEGELLSGIAIPYLSKPIPYNLTNSWGYARIPAFSCGTQRLGNGRAARVILPPPYCPRAHRIPTRPKGGSKGGNFMLRAPPLRKGRSKTNTYKIVAADPVDAVAAEHIKR